MEEKYNLDYIIGDNIIRIENEKLSVIYDLNNKTCESNNCKDYMNIINMFVNNVIN